MHRQTTSKDDVCSSVPSTQSQVDLSEKPDLQRSRLYSLMLDLFQILPRPVAVSAVYASHAVCSCAVWLIKHYVYLRDFKEMPTFEWLFGWGWGGFSRKEIKTNMQQMDEWMDGGNGSFMSLTDSHEFKHNLCTRCLME